MYILDRRARQHTAAGTYYTTQSSWVTHAWDSSIYPCISISITPNPCGRTYLAAEVGALAHDVVRTVPELWKISHAPAVIVMATTRVHVVHNEKSCQDWIYQFMRSFAPPVLCSTHRYGGGLHAKNLREKRYKDMEKTSGEAKRETSNPTLGPNTAESYRNSLHVDGVEALLEPVVQVAEPRRLEHPRHPVEAMPPRREPASKRNRPRHIIGPNRSTSQEVRPDFSKRLHLVPRRRGVRPRSLPQHAAWHRK